MKLTALVCLFFSSLFSKVLGMAGLLSVFLPIDIHHQRVTGVCYIFNSKDGFTVYWPLWSFR